MNLVSGLQFSGRHREALNSLDRVRNEIPGVSELELWIALKSGVSRAALGDVERASQCFEQALAASPRTNDLLLRALEAFANQVAFFVHDARQHGDPDPVLIPIVTEDPLEFQRRTSLIEKWSVLGTALCGTRWPPEKALWEDVRRLVEIRNELIHFKAAEYERIIPPPHEPHTMIQRMPPSVTPPPIAASWANRLLTPPLAEWAVQVADSLISHFRLAYETTRSQSRLHCDEKAPGGNQ